MKFQILVVEDNQPNMELLTDWLDIEGYTVSCAETLDAAFASVKAEPPHAVLLDVQLGNENGLDLATWMRQQPNLHHIPVLAVTAHAMVTDRERVIQAGCNACISKPINFATLKEQLDWWLSTATLVKA